MASPLMPFLGGLRNQAVEIVSALHYYAGGFGRFCDPFFGGGSISLAAKRRGFAIDCNDLAGRSFFPARALIVNDDSLPAEVVSRLTRSHPNESDYLELPKLAEQIDPAILLFCRRLWHNAATDTENYLAMRVFLDLVPMGGFGMVKRTDTSDMAKELFARSARRLEEPLALIDRSRTSINSGILSNGKTHHASMRDAVEHIAQCGANGALIAHLDPPTYGTKQYDNHYWWLDWFVGDKVAETGRGFDKKEAVAFSEACVAAAANIPIVAITQQEVSYPKKIAFGLLEAAGRRCEGFEIKSNTANPFYLVVGMKEGWRAP